MRCTKSPSFGGVLSSCTAWVGEITAPMLTTYRAGLVARLDTRGHGKARRLSPASVAFKLAALGALLKFCGLTGLMRLTNAVIAYTRASPRAAVAKPYEVLTPVEQARVVNVLTRLTTSRVRPSIETSTCRAQLVARA